MNHYATYGSMMAQSQQTGAKSIASDLSDKGSVYTGRASVMSAQTGLMFKCFDSIYGAQRVLSSIQGRGSVYGGSQYGSKLLSATKERNESVNGHDYDEDIPEEDNEDALPKNEEEKVNSFTESPYYGKAAFQTPNKANDQGKKFGFLKIFFWVRLIIII